MTWPSSETDFRSRRKKRKDAFIEACSRDGLAAWRDDGVLRSRIRERDTPDDALRRRKLDDARGQYVGQHVFYGEDCASEEWYVHRSESKRTDQYDVYSSGVLVATCGAKLLGLLVAERYRRGHLSCGMIRDFIAKSHRSSVLPVLTSSAQTNTYKSVNNK